jgi:hypothetical protein
MHAEDYLANLQPPDRQAAWEEARARGFELEDNSRILAIGRRILGFFKRRKIPEKDGVIIYTDFNDEWAKADKIWDELKNKPD